MMFRALRIAARALLESADALESLERRVVRLEHALGDRAAGSQGDHDQREMILRRLVLATFKPQWPRPEEDDDDSGEYDPRVLRN